MACIACGADIAEDSTSLIVCASCLAENQAAADALVELNPEALLLAANALVAERAGRDDGFSNIDLSDLSREDAEDAIEEVRIVLMTYLRRVDGPRAVAIRRSG